MRPVKFRAWDKEDEVMIDWFWLSSEGDLYETPVTVYDTPHLELERNDDLIAMQSTGILDKNKIEIFEGDIVEYQGRANKHPFGGRWENVISGVGEIRYEFAGYFIFERESEDHIQIDLNQLLIRYDECDIEVVGNIYET